MPPDFVVAIDGPAGAGKSTVARRVARRLTGFRYLDTGAMYRAVTAYLLRIDKLDASAEEMAEAARGLALSDGRLTVHGADQTDHIRSPEVTVHVSAVSAVPEVRRVIQGKQREVSGRVVAEGRDIGSIVFPDAGLKVYLDASLDERARRRHRQYPELAFDEYRDRIATRDRLDSSRADSPLVAPADAIVIDTSRLTIEEVVLKIEALVKERLSGSTGEADEQADTG